MLGGAIGFLILSITAASTTDVSVIDACFRSMHILAKTSVRASTIGTVITGVLLSILTHWGLFKYYWIIVKEFLTVVSIGLGIFGMYFWTLNASNMQQLMIGIVLQITSLAAMFIISVFKPWGQRKPRNI